MNRNLILVYLAAGVLASSWAMPSAPAAEPQDITLDELWEDTPTTIDLHHVWRIYRRRQLPHRLHEQLRLYLVRPREWQPDDQRPAIVFIHGGGWSNGNPDQWFPQCRYFALRGLVAASVQYRLRNDHVDVDGCLADCKSAARGWLDDAEHHRRSGRTEP